MTTVPWPVADLLPHSKTMVLIDAADAFGEGWVSASVRIAEDTLFYESPHGVPAWIGIEYMAQTVALYAGIRAKQMGREVSIGLLVGTRRYEVTTAFFSLGSELKIHAQEEWQDNQMAVFNCRIEADRVLASARLKVFLPENPMGYLRDQRT